MRNVARIVRSRAGEQPIVVISAIARATNLLEQAGKVAATGKLDDAQETLRVLIDRHYAILDDLVTDQYRNAALRSTIAQASAELLDIVRGVSILRELTPRTLDSIYCYGELLSSRLVAAALEVLDVSQEWVDTKEFMVTDEQHMRAMPIMEIVEEKLQSRILPSVAQGKVVVTQGFIGITPGGRRTTMGRESSDFSAAIIGAGLNVTDVEIWTDVDGILTADPTIVELPKKVRTLSFQEAFELSYFGAKVLHPNTMLPALEKNIPIHILNSGRPEQTGTTVTATDFQDGVVPKSIAYKRNLVQITVTPTRRRGQFIFWEQVYSILTKYNAVAVMTSSSEYALSVVLDGKHNIQAIVHELLEFGEVESATEKAAICLVGSNIRGSQFIMPRIFSALEGDYVHMIAFGATTSGVSILVDDDDVVPAVKRLHRVFFEGETDRLLFEDLHHPQTFL